MALSKQERQERNLQNTLNVTRWLSTGNVEAFASILAPDYVWESEGLLPCPGQVAGPEQAQAVLGRFLQVFPGMQQTVVMSIPHDDAVFSIIRNSGPRTHGLLGFPPIDRPYEFLACQLDFYNEDGRLKKNVFIWDEGYVLRQQGLLPNEPIFLPLTADQQAACPRIPPSYSPSFSPPLPPPPATAGTPAQEAAPDRLHRHDDDTLLSLLAEMTLVPLQLLLRSLQALMAPRRS